MKKLSFFSVFMAIVLLLTACGSNSSSSSNGGQGNGSGGDGEQGKEEIVWKFGLITKKEHPWTKTAYKFADLVKEKTNGQIKVKIYPNSQLGSEVEMLNQIKTGTVDLTVSGETMANWAPKAALMAVPYAFNSTEAMKKVVEGDIGNQIEQQIKEEVGVVPLYYHVRAPRNLTSNKPIDSPEDLQGFKMRVPNVPLFLKAWEAAGAKPQPMAFNEVFTALQQGVIEGQENPLALIYNAGFYEVQDYVNLTQHVRSWIYVVLGKEQFNSLSPELQKAVKEAAKEAQKYGMEQYKKAHKKYRKLLLDKGMKFNKDVDQKAFKKAMQSGIKESLTEEQYKLYKEMQKVR